MYSLTHFTAVWLFYSSNNFCKLYFAGNEYTSSAWWQIYHKRTNCMYIYVDILYFIVSNTSLHTIVCVYWSLNFLTGKCRDIFIGYIWLWMHLENHSFWIYATSWLLLAKRMEYAGFRRRCHRVSLTLSIHIIWIMYIEQILKPYTLQDQLNWPMSKTYLFALIYCLKVSP